MLALGQHNSLTTRLLFTACLGYKEEYTKLHSAGRLWGNPPVPSKHSPWWRHQMETFSALLAFWFTGHRWIPRTEAQWPVTRSFDVFFDLRLNQQLSKQWKRWWFEAPPRSLWRQCDASQRLEIRTYLHHAITQEPEAYTSGLLGSVKLS